MRSLLLLLLGCCAVASSAGPAAIFPFPLSPRLANYAISVRYDPDTRILTAHETITWKNPSDVPVSELRFHLYLNAFSGDYSTFMKEAGGRVRGREIGDEDWGWVKVDSLRTSTGADLRPGLEFIHPDDDNARDSTVARVSLPTPVPPHGTIVLELAFRSRLPRVIARTGYSGDFIMVGQWFPKLGVFEVPGERYATTPTWNCHQFHAQTEFYADFGVYDVSITVPAAYVVGATGSPAGETVHPDGTKTVAFHAEDVHDFAWTASPHFVVLRDHWRKVAISVLMQPAHLDQGERYISSLKSALEFFDVHVGPYPYPTFTLVDPPYGGEAAGGMEYPTLVTGETLMGIGPWLRFPELVAVHEFGHNYFYGMVATNEFEEAWMDEGFTQYYETRIMDATYGASTSVLSLAGVHLGDFEMARLGYTGMPDPYIAPITTPVWKFPRYGGSLTYFKTNVVLKTLEGLLGTVVMDSIMKVYFQRWKFRHPCGRDFVAVVNELAPALTGHRFGPDMNTFFDQTLYGTGICDYELSSVRTWVTFGPDSVRQYKATVSVSRLGEICLPVDVEVLCEDGTTARKQWDGKARYVGLEFTTESPVTTAIVDPDHRIPLDMNVLNNSRTVEPSSLPTATVWTRALFYLQTLFQCASTL
jgi:hypothetical protein